MLRHCLTKFEALKGRRWGAGSGLSPSQQLLGQHSLLLKLERLLLWLELTLKLGQLPLLGIPVLSLITKNDELLFPKIPNKTSFFHNLRLVMKKNYSDIVFLEKG